MKKQLIIPLILLIAGCTPGGIDNPEVSVEELREHIAYLASDSLKGRKPGTPEDWLAANYIGESFRSFGYEMLADKGYQYFDIITEISAGENNSLSVGEYSAGINEEFRPFNFSANGDLAAGVIFAGFGFDIETDELEWSDYKDLDVNGKWVMVLRADPELDNDDSEFIPFSGDRDKVLTAKDMGAAGVLLVSGSEYDEGDKLIELEPDPLGSDFGIPAIHIKRSIADMILAESGKTIEGLESEIISNKKPVSFDCGVVISGSSELANTEVKTQNIIGFLEGSDPELKEEIVLIGGHYDHLGLGGPASGSRVPDEEGVHYGADDNASGIAGVIEVAEKLAANRSSLRRSVIVMAFAAEEIGLLGSKQFTSDPPVDLENIKAMLNLDMIGRLKETGDLVVGGTGTSVQGESLLDDLLEDADLKVTKSPGGIGPSDHTSFYREDIPVFFFWTGTHNDYHTPRDVIDLVNFEGLKEVTDYIYRLSYNLAVRDSSLTFRESGTKAPERGARRRFKVSMGFMPNFTLNDNKGLGVDAVIPGRPADLAGIEKGDRIVAIDGKPVTNIYDYMARLAKLKYGQTITVDVMRDGEKKVFLVQLEDE